MSGHEVPTLSWDLEEETGPLINDIFLGYNTPPLTPRTSCVAFVEAEQDINNGGFYPNAHRQQNANFNTSNSTSILPNNQHPNLAENKWFDEYVSFTEEIFGSSSKSLPTNTGANFPATYDSNDYDAGAFYSNFANNFQQPTRNDRQMQDLSGPSNSNGTSTSFQFSQLNLQESSSSASAETALIPPIPESEYSASYSAPGSAYSTDWSSGSDHSSARSQDEILEEIQRECAEIERKSVSPPIRHKAHYKKRTATTLQRSSTERIASNSSNNSLAGGTSDRKKELNRIAATKYREKKRQERETLGTEHTHLETRNHQLRGIVKELRTEVNYLRKLMKDMESRAQQA
jgi:hypothetical protein